jgi:hypothetical protein
VEVWHFRFVRLWVNRKCEPHTGSGLSCAHIEDGNQSKAAKYTDLFLLATAIFVKTAGFSRIFEFSLLRNGVGTAHCRPANSAKDRVQFWAFALAMSSYNVAYLRYVCE